MSFLSRSEIDRSTTCSRTAASFHSKEDDFLSDVSLGEIIASNNGAIAAYSEHNLSMSVLSTSKLLLPHRSHQNDTSVVNDSGLMQY